MARSRWPELTVDTEHPMPIQCQLKCERLHRKKGYNTIAPRFQVLPSVTGTDAKIVVTELFVSNASTTSTLMARPVGMSRLLVHLKRAMMAL